MSVTLEIKPCKGSCHGKHNRYLPKASTAEEAVDTAYQTLAGIDYVDVFTCGSVCVDTLIDQEEGYVAYWYCGHPDDPGFREYLSRLAERQGIPSEQRFVPGETQEQWDGRHPAQGAARVESAKRVDALVGGLATPARCEQTA